MSNDRLPSTLRGWLRYLFVEAVCSFGRGCLSVGRWLGNTMLRQFVRRNIAGLANRFRYETRLMSLITRRGCFHVIRTIRIACRGIAFVFSPRRNIERIRRAGAVILGPVIAVARRDRRTLCWTAASFCGGLALLLMLSWQAFALIDHVAADNPDRLITTLRGDEHDKLDSSLKEETVRQNRQSVSEPKITVADAGDAPSAQQSPAVKSGTFDKFGLPKNSESKTPFENPQPVTTAKADPFEPNPMPAKTVSDLPDIFTEPKGNEEPAFPKTVDNGNPFAPPPKRADAPKPKPFEIKPVAKQETVAEKAASTADPLTLEIIRTDSPSVKPDKTGRFLVTSLSALPDIKPDDNDLFDSAGWTAVRWTPHGTGILPARYVQTTVTEGDPQTGVGTVAFSSTASSNWQIGTERSAETTRPAKLQYDIILPTQARLGERVPIRLRVTNIGGDIAENVAVQIDLPESLAYSVGRKLTHRVGSLKPGERHVARLTPVAIRAGEAVVLGQALSADLTHGDRQTLRIEPANQTDPASRLRQRTTVSQPCCGLSR